MKTPSSLLIGTFHVLCWVALPGLGISIWRAHSHPQADQLLAAAFEAKANMCLLHIRETDELCINYAEIHVSVDQFERLITAHCLFDTLDQAFSNYLSPVPGPPVPTAGDLLARSLAFWDSMQVLADPQDPRIAQYFDRNIWLDKKIWSSPAYQSMLNSPEGRLLLYDLRLRNGLALIQAQVKNSSNVDDRFFSPLPVLVVNPIYPYAGQSFDSEYFLENTGGAPSPVRLRFWVNDREIPVSDSGFFYRDTFRTAGVQPVHLRAELRNIVADTRESFERDYLLNVRLKN